jgi:DNA-binding transcriptional regulator YhcF (GntR family)
VWASRNVSTPLSADIPAPLSTVTRTLSKLAACAILKHVSELGDWVRVDSRAAKPLFDQLRTQIIGGVRTGQLAAGARLPTVRELAAQLGLAVNTVARAYRELESAGIVETRGRFGTFIARDDPADITMAAAARAYAETARSLGIGRAEALRYVETAFG